MIERSPMRPNPPPFPPRARTHSFQDKGRRWPADVEGEAQCERCGAPLKTLRVHVPEGEVPSQDVVMEENNTFRVTMDYDRTTVIGFDPAMLDVTLMLMGQHVHIYYRHTKERCAKYREENPTSPEQDGLKSFLNQHMQVTDDAWWEDV